MSPSEISRGSRRWRYYVSQAILQGRKAEAGSMPRLAAGAIEDKVIQEIRSSIMGADNLQLPRRHPATASSRITDWPRQALTIELNDQLAPSEERQNHPAPWTPPSPHRRREIVQGGGDFDRPIRPMRSEARNRFRSRISQRPSLARSAARRSRRQHRNDRDARKADQTINPPDPIALLPGSGAG